MAAPPPPLQLLTPELTLTLQERMESVLIQLMQMNSHTIFFREAPLFSAFRDRLGYNLSSNSRAGDPNPLEPRRDFVQCFRETIPLTLYNAYEPFVSRFFENSPRSSSVRDLLSPGFPDFIAQTSGTSGSTVKSFPRYPVPENGHYIPKGIRYCGFSSLRVSGAVNIVNEEGDLQRELPVTIIGSGIMRRRMGVELQDDDKVMSQTPPCSSVPFAVWYIPTFMGNLFMTMFFAVLDPSLVFMRASYTSIFYDAVLILEEHWDTVIDAVENGTIPDIYDLDYCRPYLEAQVKPNPHRAAELRIIEKGKEGWLREIWPLLKVVRASNSGSYAAFAAKVRHHVGPAVDIESYSYGATECMVGYGYDSANDHNLYRLSGDSYFEFLDVAEVESRMSLRQAASPCLLRRENQVHFYFPLVGGPDRATL